ncbi:hypothetical protein FRC02_000888 [Tulasnella sp. 418]|nr:hypothetical protein FRC02_000888 [Tulasnella sp. 418]
MTLEDRLRSKLVNASADHSAPSSPTTDTFAPAPPNKSDDPASIPLPPSPALAPAAEELPFEQPNDPAPLPLPAPANADPLTISLPNSPPPASIPSLVAEIAQPQDEQPPPTPMKDTQPRQSNEGAARPSIDKPLPPDIPPASNTLDVVKESEPRLSVDIELPPGIAAEQNDVEKLRERLKLVEQRFSDVSRSFKRLQAERVAADKVLKELTPLEGIADSEGLREHLRNMTMKIDMSTDEIKRLNGVMHQHDERVEELRDIHRLESKSQSEQIDKLKLQVKEVEALLTATSATTSSIEAASSSKQSTIDQLKKDLSNAQTTIKEEEEKRTKAIILLKTVRQKLVKAEKDREDMTKERDDVRAERDTAKSEIAQAKSEVDKVKSEKEKDVAGLKAQFDREVASLKEKFEKEASTRKSQFELEAITTKAAHTKDLNAKIARITQLEGIVRSLTQEKDSMFDQLQLRQAELESSQSHNESLANQNTELQHQLREATERIAMLSEETENARRDLATPDADRLPADSAVYRLPGAVSPTQGYSTPVELARLLSETEGRYEARLSDLRSKIRALEKERTESEEDWEKRISERGKEIERLRKTIAEKDESVKERQRSWEVSEEKIGKLERLVKETVLVRDELKEQLQALKIELNKARESETSLREEKADEETRISSLEKQIEELKARDAQLRSSNKTLREELKKVQSSAALLEKQRNPGVGYWASASTSPRPTVTEFPSTSASGPVVAQSNGSASPRPDSPAAVDKKSVPSANSNAEEEVNLEYLRNVILQFLENEKMRVSSRALLYFL